MRVCFVLPRASNTPIGGYKIVYEYANRLSDRGVDVSLVFLNEHALERYRLPKRMRAIAMHFLTAAYPRWFQLGDRIKKYSAADGGRAMPTDIDVAVATGADTARQTAHMFPRVRKLYLIQDLETWVMSEAELTDTFKLGMTNIAISSWLKQAVERRAETPCFLLRNPIDTGHYRVRRSIESRNRFEIGVLYHEAEHKGFSDAYAAIRLARAHNPEIHLVMFGTTRPSFPLPEWVEFTYRATQNETIEIYNRVSVFICATIREGFGLTGLEAMACGAALASTLYDGVRDYATDGVNALLSPVGNAKALSDNINRLIQDDALRIQLARNGALNAQSFSWDAATDTLVEYLRDETL